MYKGLFLPLLITLILHLTLVVVFVVPWSGGQPLVKKATPQYVKAELVTLEKPKAKPKKKTAKPKPKPKAKPKTTSPKPVKKKPVKQKTSNKADQQKRKQLELEKQKQLERQQEKERLERERREQERREQERREQELAEAMEAEETQRQVESDAELAGSYIALITDVIQRNWSRPPSARNNMEAELSLQLVPTGEVVGVSIIKSSGNTAFDRSAEQAVLKAERFPELQQLPSRVFENNFRRLRLKFRPEDLRR
jgi:colicin import membrane protein